MVDRSAHGLPGQKEPGDRALKISAWFPGIYFLNELGLGGKKGSR